MNKPLAATLVLTLAIAGVGFKDPQSTQQSATPAPQACSSEQKGDTQPSAQKAFDAARLPLSTVQLGDFPYIALPQGYVTGSTPERADFDQVPFWTGDRMQPVEGRVWSANISNAEGKTFSEIELQRNLQAVVATMGGKKIFEGKIPSDALQQVADWPRDFAIKYNSGLGDIWNDPAQVYVVHRADRDIWIHLCTYAYGGGLLIVETEPLEITAGLLPASALKAQLDNAGKVALQVNFATDQTQILETSQSQIEEVVQLLEHDPELKLVVNGYTDNTGNAARNKTLSEGRAKAVVAALTAKGIDAARLSSAGFGEADPVADNASEEGKSQNRRVELVKQQ